MKKKQKKPKQTGKLIISGDIIILCRFYIWKIWIDAWELYIKIIEKKMWYSFVKFVRPLADCCSRFYCDQNCWGTGDYFLTSLEIVVLIAQCKTAVSSVLTHWRYSSLVPSQQYCITSKIILQIVGLIPNKCNSIINTGVVFFAFNPLTWSCGKCIQVFIIFFNYFV